jgi:hypothetical protein
VAIRTGGGVTHAVLFGRVEAALVTDEIAVPPVTAAYHVTVTVDVRPEAATTFEK